MSAVKAKNITCIEVPGAYELPFAARHLIKSKKKFDAIVVLGCLIKGETMHFEYIADAVAHGLMELNVDEDIPVVFGVLTCLNEKQAHDRAFGKNNHGISWGHTAVEMGLLKKKKV
jgi:6,7-dimethyl-8-ribityllumazine synthase